MNCEVKRSKHCVICDGKEGLKIIHKVYKEISTSYAELLFKCFSIQFLDTNCGKYNMVCKQCIQSIQFCVDFRKQVEIAHKSLYNKMSAESSINKLFKIDKAEITIKPWKEIKAESDDEDNNASNTKHIPIHDNTKNLLAAEIETLSKIKEEFETMDYSDNTDTFHVTHDYSDNNDIFHEENEPESDSSSVKTDEIFRATGYKGHKVLKRKHKKKGSFSVPKLEPFSIPKLEPTQTQCPLCEKQFPDNNLLNKHHKTHYPAYICHVCGMSLMKYPKYKRHLDSHSRFEIQCDLCEKKFKTPGTLKVHKKVVHFKQSPIACHHCTEIFKSVGKRNKHMLEVHDIKPTMYKCPECDAEFNTRCHVKKHVKRKHLRIKEHHCQICYSSFFDATELRFHMEAKHEGLKRYKCEICNKTYSYRGGLRLHQRVHLKQEGYGCQLCGVTFNKQASLKHHLKTHEASQ